MTLPPDPPEQSPPVTPPETPSARPAGSQGPGYTPYPEQGHYPMQGGYPPGNPGGPSGPPFSQPGSSGPPFSQPGASGLPFPQPGPTSPGVAPLSASEATTMSLLAHLGGLLLGFLGPLLVMLIWGPRDRFTRMHSVEALNFQITLAIGWIAAIVLSVVGIGLLLMPVLWICSLVFGIQGAIAANNRRPYRYPVSLRLVS